MPLAHREVFNAIMSTEHATIPGDDLSRAGASEPVADEPRMFARRDEADLLAIRLVGGDEPERRCPTADIVF